ncbi:flagellar basal body-associated protein FliL [Vibrio sp. SM6]|uniref:Flagellar protein FliL n=1 Tax=Vibrio agarilyticus TaxID=2726741 RepID=A0A7X8TQZ8_9VIBR|nr:flagellar basal body-associated protein FliL [Vibrio agarilyticus]NLS13233.1 flagellar basal body-associated protein FliL [Vibrio agarilyticus]
MAEQPEGVVDAPKSKKTLIIIIIIAVLVLLSAAGAGYVLLSDDSPRDVTGEYQDTASAAVSNPVMYVNIAQPFVFNVMGDKRDRMVQIKVQLMVRGGENEKLAQYHSPLIESTLLSTFASATVEQLRSATGRTELRDKASGDIKASLTKTVGEPVIEKVLFTDFVIQ